MRARVLGMLSSNKVWSWTWCAVLLVIGCGSSQSKPQPTAQRAPTTASQPSQSEMCQMMNIAGAQIVTVDTSDGIVVAFTTTGDVDDLRARVRHMAAMHDPMATGLHNSGTATSAGDTTGASDLGMHEKHEQMGGEERMMGMQMVPSHASVEDIPGGARIVLAPIDPSQLAAMREQVRTHAEMMRTGKCPMMEMKEQPGSPGDEHSQHHPAGG